MLVTQMRRGRSGMLTVRCYQWTDGPSRGRQAPVTAVRRLRRFYATTNRQEAVKALAVDSDVLLLGSNQSSNSVRLVEEGRRVGARAYLNDDADSLDMGWLVAARSVGVTASAPEVLVQVVIDRLAQSFDIEVEERDSARQLVSYKLPRVSVA